MTQHAIPQSIIVFIILELNLIKIQPNFLLFLYEKGKISKMKYNFGGDMCSRLVNREKLEEQKLFL